MVHSFRNRDLVLVPSQSLFAFYTNAEILSIDDTTCQVIHFNGHPNLQTKYPLAWVKHSNESNVMLQKTHQRLFWTNIKETMMLFLTLVVSIVELYQYLCFKHKINMELRVRRRCSFTTLIRSRGSR